MQAHIDKEESRVPQTSRKLQQQATKKKVFAPPARQRLSNMLDAAVSKQYNAVLAQQRERKQLVRTLQTAKATTSKFDFSTEAT
jgi:hypothetical protein